MGVFNEAQSRNLGAICMPMRLSRPVCDISLESTCVPNFDTTIIATCEEEGMIWSDCDVLNRTNMFREGGYENALGFPRSIARMAAASADNFSST
jgi:hypothetical protein